MCNYAITRSSIFALLFGVGVVIVACAVTSCADKRETQKDPTVARKTIEQVLADHTEHWMAIPGVEGTGIGECDGAPCIVVMASRPASELEGKIPAQVEGYNVRIEITGEFKALDKE
ncbi:MAG TPA: hypothetical protein VN285_08570 [Candidatus Deferrimicrobium sp.]|nr:hypothetical protein [Candidatus Deferrimicrobium sp.]